MRPTKLDIDPANVDADGLAAANDSSGTSLTLDGALTSGGTFTSADGLGRRLDITDTATIDQSGATFTVTGTDANGNALVESLLGPASTATVTTTGYFYTVTSVAIANGAGTGTVNMGTNDEVASKVVPVNWMESDGCTVAIMGSVGVYQVDIEETFDDILADGITTATFWDKQADKTADGAFTMTPRATGIRVSTDSYTDGAEFQVYVLASIT